MFSTSSTCLISASIADITPPIITGPTVAVVVEQRDPSFSYPVVTAVDSYDGAVKVQRTGSVDNSKPLSKYKAVSDHTFCRC
jgi:hypothetical protein